MEIKRQMMGQNSSTFKAFIIEEIDNNSKGLIKEMEFGALNSNEVLVKVHYSSLNYKDALSASGNKGVTRNYLHTTGINAKREIKRKDYS